MRQKMMPDQEPYTEEQERELYRLIVSACRAEELFDLDELERFAEDAAFRREGRCPACDSPAAHLHPAVQHEGEVQRCRDRFHRAAEDAALGKGKTDV